MAQSSEIEWTDVTWNPVTGCTKISPGCQNCYAERMARRLKAMRQHRYENGFSVSLHPDLLIHPLHWIKPRMIFVNSMGDLFHKDVPTEFIEGVFEIMKKAHWHIFQILTKRAERLASFGKKFFWPENVWIGVTVENQNLVRRIQYLERLPAAVKFVSLEPLLGPINQLPLDGIDWVIVGGESGPQARPLNPKWVRKIRDMCLDKEIPFFFKQWGGFRKSRNGRELDGQTWNQWPILSQSNVSSKLGNGKLPRVVGS